MEQKDISCEIHAFDRDSVVSNPVVGAYLQLRKERFSERDATRTVADPVELWLESGCSSRLLAVSVDDKFAGGVLFARNVDGGRLPLEHQDFHLENYIPDLPKDGLYQIGALAIDKEYREHRLLPAVFDQLTSILGAEDVRFVFAEAAKAQSKIYNRQLKKQFSADVLPAAGMVLPLKESFNGHDRYLVAIKVNPDTLERCRHDSGAPSRFL